MTTVLYTGGCLLADSRLSEGESKVFRGSVSKLFELNGRHFTVSGYFALGYTFAHDLANEAGDLPELDEETTVYELLRDSRLAVHEYGGYGIPYHFEPQVSVGFGTGGPLALAAYLGGALPMRAMEIAAQIDPQSGGPFHAVRYDNTKQEFVTWSTR